MNPGPYLFLRHDGGYLYVMVDGKGHCRFFNPDGTNPCKGRRFLPTTVQNSLKFGRLVPLVAFFGAYGQLQHSTPSDAATAPIPRRKPDSDVPAPSSINRRAPTEHGRSDVTVKGVPRFEPWGTGQGGDTGGFSGPNGIYAPLDPADWKRQHP